MQIVKLDKTLHRREPFDCGMAPLNNFLRCYSNQHDKKHLSRTYVATPTDNQHTIAGYYSLALTQVDLTHLSAKDRNRYPKGLNAALLGRLAVDLNFQGKGIGGLLLIDAILRAYIASLSVPTPMLIVDAKDKAAADFYHHYGFTPLPDTPLKLMLAMKNAEVLLTNADLL